MERMISVAIHTTESLEACPCRRENQTVEYYDPGWADPHMARGAVVTLERFVFGPDGWNASGAAEAPASRAAPAGRMGRVSGLT